MKMLSRLSSFLVLGVGLGAVSLVGVGSVAAQSLAPAHAPEQNWSFKGPLGHFDLAAVQRGYAVFAGVCASCHGLSDLHFSDLTGTGLTSEQVSALAAAWQVADGLDAEGRLKHRKASPDDGLPAPYPNAQAARAANRGAVPPDLSRITQVYPGGADRVFALLTGYTVSAHTSVPAAAGNSGNLIEAKAEKTADHDAGGFANRYAIGHRTAMPPPLRPAAVAYSDGTPPTVEQEARDVTTFLAWVSNPHADSKRRLGVGVTLYLCFLAILLVILKRRIWSDVRR